MGDQFAAARAQLRFSGAGALRAPWKWEELIVESAVIGGTDRSEGKQRWRRRLDGLAAEYRLRLSELEREEVDSPRRAAILRDQRNLRHLREFALPIIDTLGDWPQAATWGEWLNRLTELAPRVLRRVSPNIGRLSTHNPQLILALTICLGLSVAAQKIGLAAIIGAFFAGLTFSDFSPRWNLQPRVEAINEFLAPFFFFTMGARLDLRILTPDLLVSAAVICLLAIVAKMVGCGLPVLGRGRAILVDSFLRDFDLDTVRCHLADVVDWKVKDTNMTDVERQAMWHLARTHGSS